MKLLTKYPIKTEIWEKRGETIFIKNDKATRLREKDGKYIFKIRKEKLETKPIDPKYIYMTTRGRSILKLFSPKAGVYMPIKFNPEGEDDANFNIMNEDTRRWIVNDAREAHMRFMKKEGFWDKYGLHVITITFFSLLIIAFMFDMAHMQMIKETAINVVSQLSKAVSTVNAGPAPPI